jgi:hypothetical protein
MEAFLMRKILIIALLAALFLAPAVLASEESKAVLGLKKEVLQERVMRIQLQLEVMRQQFREAQTALTGAKKDLEDLDIKLKVLEAQPVQPPKE